MGYYPFRPGHSRYSIFKQAINLFYYAEDDIFDEKIILHVIFLTSVPH